MRQGAFCLRTRAGVQIQDIQLLEDEVWEEQVIAFRECRTVLMISAVPFVHLKSLKFQETTIDNPRRSPIT
jgi:hypothetical protein